MIKVILKNCILGAGTVLEIHPQTDYAQLRPAFSDAENLARDWSAVGKDFRVAVVKVVGPQYWPAQTYKIVGIPSQKKVGQQKVAVELLYDRTKRRPTPRDNRRKSKVAR